MSQGWNTFSFVLMGALGLSAAVGASSLGFSRFAEKNDTVFINRLSGHGGAGLGFETSGPPVQGSFAQLPPAALRGEKNGIPFSPEDLASLS